jgi:hypothetical protein
MPGGGLMFNTTSRYLGPKEEAAFLDCGAVGPKLLHYLIATT